MRKAKKMNKNLKPYIIRQRKRNKERMRKLRDDPKYREEQAMIQKELRATDDYKKYFAQYMRDYYIMNPTAKKIHNIRLYLNNLVKRKTFRSQIEYDTARFLEKQFEKNKHLKDPVINHKISLKHFLDFNENLPKEIMNNVINLEVIERSKNSSIRDYLNKDSYRLAKKLEKMYPDELKDFSFFILNRLEKYKGHAA